MNFRAVSGRFAGQAEPTEETPLAEDEANPKQPKLKLPAEESVYAAILFLPPISRLISGSEWNRSARLAILLCILNALLQMGVVQVISIYDHQSTVSNTRLLLPADEIVENGHDEFGRSQKAAHDFAAKEDRNLRRALLPPYERAQLDGVDDIQPLCNRIGDGNGTFTCMPQSVKFAYDWNDLDTDGDGLWTLAEAKADESNLKEKRKVSPETVFHNLINGLRLQAQFVAHSGPNRSFYLSNDVDQERAIPKAYFNFWKGDAMMCSLFDSNSCEAAAKAGVFEAALVPGRTSAGAKGIHDLDSAIEYCYRMLQSGGGCDHLLPTDFKRNREQRWGRCGTRSYAEGGKYTNPYDWGQSVHVLEATYATVGTYQRSTSSLYLFFLSLIIMLWLLSLIDEWRELIKMGEFLIRFPGLQQGDPGGFITSDPTEGPDGDTTYRITAISQKHRAVLSFFYLVRVLVCVVLTQFGTKFLLVENNYLSLVLNSLALTFILTIDAMLYDLIEKDVKQEVAKTKPLKFLTRLPTQGWAGYFLKKECWGLFLVPILSVCLVLHYTYQQKLPMLTVLRCACTQEGDKCLDSIQYQAGWWKDYWGKVLPSAMHQIEALRIAGK